MGVPCGIVSAVQWRRRNWSHALPSKQQRDELYLLHDTSLHHKHSASVHALQRGSKNHDSGVTRTILWSPSTKISDPPDRAQRREKALSSRRINLASF